MKKVLKTVILVLVLALVCAVGLLLIAPLTETYRQVAVEDSTDWMAGLPDDLLISEIAIPGTHDSGTQYVQLAYFSKCQASGISTQQKHLRFRI